MHALSSCSAIWNTITLSGMQSSVSTNGKGKCQFLCLLRSAHNNNLILFNSPKMFFFFFFVDSELISHFHYHLNDLVRNNAFALIL